MSARKRESFFASWGGPTSSPQRSCFTPHALHPLLLSCNISDTFQARMNYYLGLAPRPFDRHDWTVDRCGIEVRMLQGVSAS